MKNKLLGLLVLATPMVLATPSCVTTTINGLVLDVKGQVYNYNTAEDVVELTTGNSFNCSWANNLSASNFELPSEFNGKEISKIDRKSDRVIDVSFSKACTEGDKTGRLSIGAKSSAFKGAKVTNAFALVRLEKSGMPNMSRDYEETEGLKYTGNMQGCIANDATDINKMTITIKDGQCATYQDVEVKGFSDCELWIGSRSADNKFGFALYDIKVGTTTEKYGECSITIPSSVYAKVKTNAIFKNIEKN